MPSRMKETQSDPDAPQEKNSVAFAKEPLQLEVGSIQLSILVLVPAEFAPCESTDKIQTYIHTYIHTYLLTYMHT